MTLGEIVTLRPSLAADLERRGLDYCCHGGRNLAEAAREAGLDAQTVADGPQSGTRALAAQIDALATEHETVGELLDELNRATSGYATPADGCASYTACYRALADLEADTHLHVHKENNLLFPAARADRARPSVVGATG